MSKGIRLEVKFRRKPNGAITFVCPLCGKTVVNKRHKEGDAVSCHTEGKTNRRVHWNYGNYSKLYWKEASQNLLILVESKPLDILAERLSNV